MRIAVHVKIDTGMGRTRVSSGRGRSDFIQELNGLRGHPWCEGLMTHFADADLSDKAFAAQQMDRFESAAEDTR